MDAKFIIVLICLLSVLFIQSIGKYKQNTTLESYSLYLSGGSSRQWNVVDNYPKDTSASCNFPSIRSVDNTYTFFSTNTYSFDHGGILQQSKNDYCIDSENYLADWYFIENGTKLVNQIIKVNNSIYQGVKDTMVVNTISDTIIVFSKN